MPWKCCFVAMAAAAMPLGVGGCRRSVFFPAVPAEVRPGPPRVAVYDVRGDGKHVVGFAEGPAGRVVRLLYGPDANGTAPDVVDLDAIDFSHCRHLVLILDGVGYDLVREFYQAGHLRLFHPPSRLIAPYPTLTDLCFQDLFDLGPVRAFEAEYYDHRAGRMVGGAGAYLRGENAPYNRLLHHRANMIFDAVGYVMPWAVFGKEVNDAKALFDRRRSREVRCYFVSSAGMGTTAAAAGHRRCLEKIERLVNQVVWETRGLTKVTLLSDHGHSYTPARPVGLGEHLRGRGWRLTERLRGRRDAAWVRLGLETYAALSTKDPQRLVEDVAACEGVDLASCAVGDAVLVRSSDGSWATIHRKGRRYAYRPHGGDPLKLRPALAALRADAEGFYDADELLVATARCEYPAPLQRLWRAHFALVEDPADVIVSLKDAFYSGSPTLARFTKVASTHGSLNRRNSTAFIMSTLGPLPEVLRSADVPAQMKALTGSDWPAAR